jgi:CRISPR-associated protein Csb2
MLALGIRYLNGFVVASHGTRERVEWPPHPARVFMALVAAHYQTGADAPEREALLWLEKQPPPEIHAPEAWPCAVVTQFVPVNDDSAQCHKDPKTKKVKFYQEIPGTSLRRNRQDRSFARAALAGDTVWLAWPHANPELKVRDALAGLCGKVTRIGHSISLVQMWLADAVPAGPQRWIEDETRSTQQLRVPRGGTLTEVLDPSFNGKDVARYAEMLLAIENATDSREKAAAKKAMKEAFPHGEPRQDRPHIATCASYARAEEIADTPAAPGTVLSPHLLVFSLERRDGPYRCLDLLCTLVLTERWREALVSQANELSAEAQQIISGHGPERKPLESPHLAFLPLAAVGHAHADGHLLGAALALPGELPFSVRQEVGQAAGRVRELALGRLGKWSLEPLTMARPPVALRAATWTAHPEGATHWASVTPVAFDQHPKAKDKAACQEEAAAMIAAACERIGLPRPREVIVTLMSAHLGAPPAHAYPRLRRKDGSERRHTHAILVFAEPVRGPVLLGAGRYRGYGFFRPMELQ